MTAYRNLKIGESITVEGEGLAAAAMRWANRKGMKYSRKKGEDGLYVVTRIA